MMPRLPLALFALLIVFLAFVIDVAFAYNFGSSHGLWLIGAGLAFIVLEMLLPTKGALAVLGAAMFAYGTVSLTDSNDPDLRLTWSMVILLNSLVLGTLAVIAFLTVRGYKNGNSANPLIGQTAKVIQWDADAKRVECAGSVWQANSKNTFSVGDKAVVTAQDNLTLHITSYGDT